MSNIAGSLVGQLLNEEGNNGQNPMTGADGGGASYISQYSNRLFGAPFQLLDSVDKRFPEINNDLGNEYLRNFMLNSPILHIRPGMPHYTGDQNKTSLYNLLLNIYGDIVTSAGNMSLGEAAFNNLGSAMIFGMGKKLQGRMFGFRETYYEYIQNVNYMCKTAATHMSLTTGAQFPNGCHTSGGGWETFDSIDWQNYRMGAERGNSNPSSQLGKFAGVIGSNIAGTAGSAVDALYSNILGQATPEWAEAAMQSSASSVLGNISSKLSSVDFMVEPIAFTEQLTNTTADSFIEGMIDGITKGIGTEIAWITNSNADTGMIGDLMNFLGDTVHSASQAVGELVQGVGGGFTKNLFTGAIAAIKGQKMIYPKIYDSSESRMDYEFSITLTTPYGDPYNYYMNIVVPLLHLIALTAPRMISANTVASPFVVQAYIPGMCTCQLGIIQNMTITKNPSTNHVSVNGFPLTVKVTFTIEELYNAMSISPANDPASFMFNETLNDYLCNLAGLMPSQDTYAKQRNANFQAIGEYFDHALFLQDFGSGVVDWIENHFTTRLG